MSDRLDSLKDECRLSRVNSFLVLYKESDDIFENNEEIIMEYDFSDGRLYFSEVRFRDFITWFPIAVDDAKKFVVDWFEKTYNVDVAYIRVL